MIPWRLAWHEALYGAGGFYRRPEGPAGHFTTSANGPLAEPFARAMGVLIDREQVCRVVDLGCGRGELLHHLAELRPDLALVGVDVVDRPPGLPASVRWLRSPGGAGLPEELADLGDTLVLAHEWLDVVPCTIAEVDDEGALREVLVDPATGREALGDPLEPEEADWVARWWPPARVAAGASGRGGGCGTSRSDVAGRRVEIGRSRDEAYAAVLARVDSGLVLAVDYGHDRASRPAGGSLAAFRDGVEVRPVPDGSCDITAHVALDSLGADHVATQREWLRELGLTGARPATEIAHADPTGYLAELSRANAAAVLRDPSGLGGFGWAITRVGRSPA